MRGPRLIVVNGNHEIALPTDKKEIIIGREDPVSHIFPEVDLTPFGGESGGVSRQHARINNEGGEWSITDLNSTNYTHVDGKRLEPNTALPVRDGVQIRFGRVATVFKL
jgi:pSer/pThr/pTyr-binding forkhead associated (FHA) protein